ncbi:hypothetical protein TrVFT333_005103 [Trichoderma virens FT-333]|nr:hypothetical protein TrVFT333_005103 [Trichoderma virens FT-333]
MSGPTTFEFVVGDRPDQLKAGSNPKLRSHLSKRGWQVYLLQHNDEASSSSSSASAPVKKVDQQREDRAKRKKRKRLQHTVTWELPAPNDPESQGTSNNALVQSLMRANAARTAQTMTIDYQLGGGRVDPFRSYPAPWKPYIPHLVDHYIVHMAVDIPELDEPGEKGLLRSRWFRLATTEISTFQVVLLLSAGNYITVKGGIAAEAGFEMEQLRFDAIKSINQAIASPSACSDSIIGAVAKMASFESMHGDERYFRLHMDATKRMVTMRGGLYNLGLGGLLRRMLIWIDLNGGHLMNTPRWFPGHNFAGSEEEEVEPNPERFIAI